ncbi:hypothetical protein [Flavobacterium limi]|uniref:Uncharacterized protein n=1 Tax=Flavobacterium limi TaxID=2045105 RepID=A0ABQ1UQW8_9FLAO|nr:hypothetical protein [Flavobacterium limi]GGF24970.1 hypothetical protein GCM10011518_37910 [Flavobacterium limi]
MKNRIEIDGTNDDIWNFDGARANWNISTLTAIKNNLKLGDICTIKLPTYNIDNIANNVIACFKYFIVDFAENFTYEINNNIIDLKRVNNKEYYKIDI